MERRNVGSSRLFRNVTQVEVAELVAQDPAASIYFAVIALNVRHIHPTRFFLLTLHFPCVSTLPLAEVHESCCSCLISVIPWPVFPVCSKGQGRGRGGGKQTRVESRNKKHTRTLGRPENDGGRFHLGSRASTLLLRSAPHYSDYSDYSDYSGLLGASELVV